MNNERKANKKKKRSIVRGVALAIFAIVILVSLTLTPGKQKGLKPGDMAPDFELVDLDGNTHRLSDYRGEGVFLNFWGTWCAPCKREMPFMEKQYQTFKDEGVHILAVNVKESDLKVDSFRRSYQLSFPIAIDKTEAVKDAYQIKPLPTTILIDPDGKIVEIVQDEMNELEIKNYMEMIQPK
ncbi:MAG TPA: thiol-disulfide oxidoreductase ResA [Savagea sp.]